MKGSPKYTISSSNISGIPPQLLAASNVNIVHNQANSKPNITTQQVQPTHTQSPTVSPSTSSNKGINLNTSDDEEDSDSEEEPTKHCLYCFTTSSPTWVYGSFGGQQVQVCEK